MAVISPGVKSILDIGLTLETLETLEVPVLAYRPDEFLEDEIPATPFLLGRIAIR